jgi:hypothetical protein
MRVVHVVDAAQAQAQILQRVSPPTDSPPRKVQAVNRQADPEDQAGVGTAPPDDGITLALSPEAREAARLAELAHLKASLSKQKDGDSQDAETTNPETENQLSGEREDVRQLEQKDREVRATQLARAAAAGGLGSVPTFAYKVGPDGRLYAVSGQVTLDTNPVPGDPEATLRKARQIEKAAFMPGDPSSEDRRAAAMAATLAARARQELALKQDAQANRLTRTDVAHVDEVG